MIDARISPVPISAQVGRQEQWYFGKKAHIDVETRIAQPGDALCRRVFVTA